jgi:hypothetical protein
MPARVFAGRFIFLAAGDLKRLLENLRLHGLLAQKPLHLAQLVLLRAIIGGWNDLFLRSRRRQPPCAARRTTGSAQPLDGAPPDSP